MKTQFNSKHYSLLNRNEDEMATAIYIAELLSGSLSELKNVTGSKLLALRHDLIPGFKGGLGMRYSARLSSNRSNIARLLLAENDTVSIIFYRLFAGELTELERVDNIQPKDLEITWWKHTAMATRIPKIAKFEYGQVYATPGAQNEFSEDEIRKAFSRHICGDWADTCPEDAKMNDEALKDGGRIFSVHNFGEKKLWIITEAEYKGHRSATTILMPSEY